MGEEEVEEEVEAEVGEEEVEGVEAVVEVNNFSCHPSKYFFPARYWSKRST